MPTVSVPDAFTPETRLLLHLLRAALGSPEPASAPLAARGLDWAAFAAQVNRHRAAPFLAHHLPAEQKAGLPPAMLRGLLEAAAVTMARARVRVEVLARVVRTLEDGGIPVRVVKGPLLAQEVYGSIGARHAGDLDLLVDAEHVERAGALLRASGLRQMVPDFELTPRQRRVFLKLSHEYGYLDPATGVRIELTWRLGDGALTAEALREEGRLAELAGRPVRALARHTETAYLLAHGARHRWQRLFWLVDVALLLRDETVSWAVVLASARRRGELRTAWQGALLAHQLLGAPLPPALGSAPPRAVASLVRDSRRHVAAAEGEVLDTDRGLRRAAHLLRGRDHWAARLRLLPSHLLAFEDWKSVRLPDRLFALYYLVRPVNWVRRRLQWPLAR